MKITVSISFLQKIFFKNCYFNYFFLQKKIFVKSYYFNYFSDKNYVLFKNYFSLKLKNRALNDQVNFIIDFFQTCTEVYDLLNNGDFGASGQKAVENYRKSCHEIFPLATKFSLEQPQHHVNNNSVNSDKSSKLKSNDEIEP